MGGGGLALNVGGFFLGLFFAKAGVSIRLRFVKSRNARIGVCGGVWFAPVLFGEEEDIACSCFTDVLIYNVR